MRMIITGIFGLLIVMSFSGCGNQSLVECDSTTETEDSSGNCVPKTKDEQAINALAASNWDLAITLLNELIADDLADGDKIIDWRRYPRLAAAYAGKAGLNVLNAANEPVAGSSIPAGFFPTPDQTNLSAYRTSNITPLKTAISKLNTLLANSTFTSEKSNATLVASVKSQLKLYDSALALMTMAMFQPPSSPDSNIDPEELLEQMTDADVAQIIGSLEAAAQDESGEDGLSQSAAAKLEEINAAPGATQSEKLRNLLAEEDG